ncbi:MAG: cell division protein ZapE [Paracoccaceae bacterium]
MSRYRALVADGQLRADPVQAAAVEKLQLLHQRLRGYVPERGKRVGLGWLGFGRREEPDRKLTGLYLYGGVGRGKSMLMDLFFDRAPVTPKRRVHFHAFMAEVHVGVHVARESNVADPIKPVAEEVAESATLLCFDEFEVNDITDAMILGRLFEALFARGVVVVATSNRAPDELYKDGLNRALFLPFIALLKREMDVIELNSPTDYRQGRAGSGAERYFAPFGRAASAGFEEAWRRALEGRNAGPETLTVGGRKVTLPLAANEAARADFETLCERPLGASDYLAIARRYGTLFLEGVPRMGRAEANAAKRFVTLVDACYEAGVALVVLADGPPEALFSEGPGAFEFARTASRLAEMRSADWPRAEAS